MAYRSRAHRHPSHPRTPAAPARAPPRPGERGVTVWDGNSPSMLSPGSTTQRTRGGGPAHKSGSRASSLTSTALNTSAPSLPTHPPRPGPRRAISGDLALSRAISGPRRAISGDLGASLARRHTCSKKEGPGWSHGAHALARGAASLCATFEALARAGEAAPRAARSSPSTPTPAHTAHLGPPGVTLALAQDPGDSLPPTSDGLGRCCAPLALVCMSRVPACQG